MFSNVLNNCVFFHLEQKRRFWSKFEFVGGPPTSGFCGFDADIWNLGQKPHFLKMGENSYFWIK